MKKYHNIVDKIQSTPFKLTFVSSGGGTNAISALLKVPGASNTVLESYIPYSKESMDSFLNKKPDHYCSLDTCLSMAANAFKKSKELDAKTKTKYLIGIAVTANLCLLDITKVNLPSSINILFPFFNFLRIPGYGKLILE